MAVFNNLVVFDPNEKTNSPDKIVPDLAESWSWNADQTKLTFKLRSGVKWHDGKPFTAKDVKWSFDRAVSVGGFPTFQMAAGSLEKPEQFVTVEDSMSMVHRSAGVLRPAASEILRCDTDPNFPERGAIAFDVRGER